LIRDNIITGGMVVKVNAALDALSAGVKEAVITNLDGLARGMGTVVSA
jgi:acetylglutamate kinase